MAHPHDACTVCKDIRDVSLVTFVEFCIKNLKGTISFTELFEKLEKAGFRVTRLEPEKKEETKT